MMEMIGTGKKVNIRVWKSPPGSDDLRHTLIANEPARITDAGDARQQAKQVLRALRDEDPALRQWTLAVQVIDAKTGHALSLGSFSCGIQFGWEWDPVRQEMFAIGETH